MANGAERTNETTARIDAERAKGLKGPRAPELQVLVAQHEMLLPHVQEKARRVEFLKAEIESLRLPGHTVRIANLKDELAGVQLNLASKEKQINNLEAVIAALLKKAEEEENRKKREYARAARVASAAAVAVVVPAVVRSLVPTTRFRGPNRRPAQAYRTLKTRDPSRTPTLSRGPRLSPSPFAPAAFRPAPAKGRSAPMALGFSFGRGVPAAVAAGPR